MHIFWLFLKSHATVYTVSYAVCSHSPVFVEAAQQELSSSTQGSSVVGQGQGLSQLSAQEGCT